MTDRVVFNVNDVCLASYCPLTLKVNTRHRYNKFIDMLDVFDTEELTYINSYLTYFPYILKSILYNAFETNKNILTYESYFFNVCHGYSRKNALDLSAALFSRYWSSFITQVKLIFDLQSGDFLGTNLFPEIHTKSKFINCDPVNVPLKLDVLLTNYYVESPNHHVLVVPKYKYKSIYHNQLVMRMINNYPKDSITVLELSLDDAIINVTTIHPSVNTINYINTHIENSYIDFKSIHFSHCSYCPYKGTCSSKEMYNSLSTVVSVGKVANRTVHTVKG